VRGALLALPVLLAVLAGCSRVHCTCADDGTVASLETTSASLEAFSQRYEDAMAQCRQACRDLVAKEK
jgi:hypothetical protein